MEQSDGEAPTGGSKAEAVIGRTGVASVGVASVAAAVAGYLVLVVVARRVPQDVNANFLVFWSLFFAGYGVLGGLQQEATRAVGTTMLEGGAGRAGGARVMPWSLLVGAGLAVVTAASSPWWFPTLLVGQPSVVVGVLCAAVVVLAGHVTLVGILAGRRLWTLSAVLTGGESMLRLGLVGVAVAIGAGLVGLEIATVASAVFWLLLIASSRRARTAIGTRGVDTPRRVISRAAQAMVAAAGSAALVVGFPTLLRLSASSGEWATAAPLVLAISLTRAPLLMPLNAYQGVAITYFLDPRRSRGAALARIVGVIVGFGLVGAALAWLVGPWLMALFFGAGYRVSGVLLGSLMLDAVALAVVTMTGACVLALGRHRAYAIGWIVAAVASAGLVLLPMPLDSRAVLALGASPLLGAVIHLVALRGATAPATLRGAGTVTARGAGPRPAVR